MNRVVIILFLLISCSNLKNNSPVHIDNYLQKKIVLPKLFVHNDCSKFKPVAKYKVIAYINGDCSFCLNDLVKWQQLLNELNCTSLFFIHTFDSLALMSELERIQFDLSFCIDKNQNFLIMNHLPSNRDFHCFLIDRLDSIITIGNPIDKWDEREELFKNLLQNAGKNIIR